MIVVLAMMLIACTSSQHRAVLDSADSLMNARPDAEGRPHALPPAAHQRREQVRHRPHRPPETGWRVSNRSVPIQMNYTKIHQNGLQTMLYEKTTNGKTEYAYVYAGSNSVEDWAENIAQIGGMSPQYSMAIRNAHVLSEELGSIELTFIGHSLGGGEAAAASMATGRAAITFNPAAVSSYTRIIHGLGSAKNVVNYIATGKRIGVTPFMFGGDILNNLQNNVGMSPPGKRIDVNVGSKPTHSIKEFLKPNINLPEP